MGEEYKCPLCGGVYQEGEVMSVECTECHNRVCLFCVSSTSDKCDGCADILSEVTQGDKSEYEIAEEWVEEVRSRNLSYEQVQKIFEIVRYRYRRQLEKQH